MWVSVIKSIHGNVFNKTEGNSVWTSIVRLCSKTVDDNLLPPNLICMDVGNGRSVKFWHDLWCGDSCLASRYNRLFHLDVNKNDSVADKWVNGDWQWVWSREEIGSRNLALLNSLRHEINQVFICEREDKWVFSPASDGLFSVKKTRDIIDSRNLITSNTSTVWFKFIPRKVNVFLWRFRLNALPLRWNLSAKGIEINSIVCPVCNNGVEDLSHLFFGCSFALDIWYKSRLWMDCGFPSLHSWDDLFSWFGASSFTNGMKDKVIGIVVTILWALWRFRNGIVFNESFSSRSSLFDVIRLLSFRWLKNRGHRVSNWNT
ncbi:uncharacterized protein [Rutidosis leptorrhynchoides]|uniref:uncharacterized protein n=1 Tax=Rutidosis leptorrhynchoides TaxID=125765 RepID=UPI003A98CE51